MSKEINLLPLSRRRQLARRFMERQLRKFARSITMALGIVTLGGVLSIVLLQVFGTVSFDAVGNDLGDAVIAYRTETKAIADQNRLIEEMAEKHEDRLAWSELFDDVLAALPAGTQLEAMSGTLESRRIEIQGRAAARSALVVAEERLRALPWVTDVQAPHSNLLDRTNPSFTFIVLL